MKERLTVLLNRINAMDLRRRLLVFAAAVALLIDLVYSFALAPMYSRQNALKTELIQQHARVAELDAEMAKVALAFEHDPDALARKQLAAVKQESEQLSKGLIAMERGLVAPDRMVPLLQKIMGAHAGLKLISLRKLPVEGLSEGGFKLKEAPVAAAAPQAALRSAAPAMIAKMTTPGAPPAAAAATAPHDLLYRHGVEIVVQGNYGDLVKYLSALEQLPAQLIWGGATLGVEKYPDSRLTLTLYTLSMDEKWMRL
jgi:MSHA biogenesis protein MshJ